MMPREVVKAGLAHGLSVATVERIRINHKTNSVQEMAQIAVKAALQREVAKVGNQVRETLGDVLAQQATVMAKNPAKKLSDLRNTPARQGLAAVAKTLAETGAAVFGWSASDSGAAVKSGEMRALDEVIDITPAPPKALEP